MKKKLFNAGMLAMALTFIFVLCACASAPFVLDDALPESDMATVFWYAGLHPTSFNGIPIEQKKWLIAIYSTWQNRSVKVPSGAAEVILNVDWDGGYVRWKGNDFIFNYSFEAGKEYVIAFNVSNDFTPKPADGINKWGVGVYEQAPPKLMTSLGMNPKNAIEFVPFTNQPTSVTTTTRYY